MWEEVFLTLCLHHLRNYCTHAIPYTKNMTSTDLKKPPRIAFLWQLFITTISVLQKLKIMAITFLKSFCSHLYKSGKNDKFLLTGSK